MPALKPTACSLTRYHRPRPVQIDQHHVWPLAHGGPDDPGNIVAACPSCHTSVHALLRLYARVGGKPAWRDRRRFPRGVQRVAALGWRRLTTRSMR